jgi:ketosteroid isomerase-like protein
MRLRDRGGLQEAVSQTNVGLVRAIYDAFGRRDVDAVFAAMKPDIEWDESEGMPYGGVYRGRAAIVQNVFGPILADVEDFTADPDEILPLDDARVMARAGTAAQAPPVRPDSSTFGPSRTTRSLATSSSPTRGNSATPSGSSGAPGGERDTHPGAARMRADQRAVTRGPPEPVSRPLGGSIHSAVGCPPDTSVAAAPRAKRQRVARLWLSVQTHCWGTVNGTGGCRSERAFTAVVVEGSHRPSL